MDINDINGLCICTPNKAEAGAEDISLKGVTRQQV